MVIPIIGLTVLIFSTSFKQTPLPVNYKSTFKVVIDAGHGGMDYGASTANTKEKDITLALSKALQQKALGTNISISFTREGDELPVAGNIKESLKKRVALVQETDADAMVSLHVGNAHPLSTKDLHGIHAFIAGKNEESAIMSRSLATALLNGLTGGPLDVMPTIQQRSEGIYVLDNNLKPAVLLEVGYISNSKDLVILSDADEINLLAERILLGLQQYAVKAKP
jgi:N-acetylmuramoyl-L-alanine amidase